MKKVVLRVAVNNNKAKNKVFTKIAGHQGVDSVSIDMKDKKLTVIGDIDPISIVSKLRKLCLAEILSVGPAKELGKKDNREKKKDDEQKRKEELDKVCSGSAYAMLFAEGNF